MILSNNELESTVNKAFLGIRKKCGESDVAATMVSTLQILKLDGVRHFNNAFHFIKLEKDTSFKIESSGANSLSIDLLGCSLLCHIPLIMDYAVQELSDKSFLEIKIKNCHNRWLLYGYLAYLASKGFKSLAKWTNGKNPKNVACVFNSSFPNIFLSDSENNFIRDESYKNAVTITISRKDFDMSSLSANYETNLTPDNLKNRSISSLHRGIFVSDSDWKTLKRNASLLFVENSEKSILGAGELQRKVS